MRFSVFSLSLVLALLVIACGDDSSATDASPADTGALDGAVPDAPSDVGASDADSSDAGSGDAGSSDTGSVDSAPAPDATELDSGVADAAIEDAPVLDTGRDAAGACHAYNFGRPAADIVRVDSLPAMTGGVIPMGVFDAIEARTTGMITGTYRGTWAFDSATTVQTLDQITLSGAPPAPVPHTESYRTEGANLTRNRTCAGDQMFDNQYRVRAEGGLTFLDVRSGGLLFTFQQRAD